MRIAHCTVALVALALSAVSGAAQSPQAAPATEYTVFFQGMAVGAEEVSVARTPQEIVISGNERIGPPVNVITRRAEFRYTADWRPIEVLIEGSIGDRQVLIQTIVSGTTAATTVTRGTDVIKKTDEIASDALLLPNIFFGAYEALAERLPGKKVGDVLPGYIPPGGVIKLTVTGVADDRVRTQDGVVELRRYTLEVASQAAPILIEVWVDSTGRMLRFAVPVQGFDIVRRDLASVTARRESVTRPNDELVRIPANGFSLAATISQPTGARTPKVRLPAVVLVGGSAPTDRDETFSGIQVLGQLASALADAGYIVVRYDKRGIGQSGGRAESASLEDYADDVLSVMRFLEKRKDVDSKRVALVGYGEGGAIASYAASRNDHAAALVLVAAPGVTGAELVLEQQRRLLSLMNLTDAERREKLELQEKIQKAVVSGSWPESIPQLMRRQADTPWYRSFLLFDPAQTLKKTEQPILIVHGELDRLIAPTNADQLARIARSRKGRAGASVEEVKLPGVNHLLANAKTGEADEYDRLPEKKISPAVSSAITSWLETAMRKR